MRASDEITSADVKELVQMLLRNPRFWTKSCLETLLRRVQREAVINPGEMTQLAVLGPDLVDRCAGSLGRRKDTYMLRAYGVLGDLFCSMGAPREAERHLQSADLHRDAADRLEIEGLNIRWAILRLHQSRFSEALSLAGAAVEHFRNHRDNFVERDDLSLAGALVNRGIIYIWGNCSGEGYSAAAAVKDFEEALVVSSNKTPICRLSAVKNLGTAAVWTWLTAEPRPEDPLKVYHRLDWVRAQARRQKIPRKSVFDARARWTQAMAIAELTKGLSPQASNLFSTALADLEEIGAPQDVAALLLDYQWWLLHDGKWGLALRHQKKLEELAPLLPETWQGLVAQWGLELERQRVSAEVVEKVFHGVRGIRGVVSPAPGPVGSTGGW